MKNIDKEECTAGSRVDEGISLEEQLYVAEIEIKIMNEHYGRLAAAINSMAECMAFDSRDWSIDRSDAWLYGIVFGWGVPLDQFSKDSNERLSKLHDGLRKFMKVKDPRRWSE